jgi:predicted phage tail protein
MANALESEDSSSSGATDAAPSSGLRMGVIAMASLLVGGLAAVLWYRNTINKLHQAEERQVNTDFGILEED